MSTLIEYLLGCATIAAFLMLLGLSAQFIRYVYLGRLDVRDLVCQPSATSSGYQLDVDKCWLHIGRGVLTMAMVKDISEGSPSLELQAALFALIAGHEIARRMTKKVAPAVVANRRASDRSDKPEEARK